MLDKGDLKEIRTIFKEEIGVVLKKELVPIKKDLTILKRDVSILKTDVATLKHDVSDLKFDISNLKEDTALLKRAVISLENTYKYYSDLFYLNKDNISKLAHRTNTLENKVGIKSPQELAISGI